MERWVELWTTGRHTSLRMLAYDELGAGGPSLVALCGLGASVDVLREVVAGFDPFAALAARGFNVLALDWPGHGRSGGPPGHLTYRLAADAVAFAVEVARDRWDGPVGLFGTGLGGVLAFCAAAEGAAVDALACHNVLDLRNVQPVLRRARLGIVTPLAARLSRLLSVGQQRLVDVPTAALVARSDLAEDPRLARRLRRHPQALRRYDLAGLVSIFLTPQDKPDPAEQRVPTLVAVGAEDPVIPEAVTRAFVSRLTCPSQLWVLPAAGHQLLLEHPRALLPAVAEFLHAHLSRPSAGVGA
jgi:alpha-beta hydrolase superfamily lysophospholipase